MRTLLLLTGFWTAAAIAGPATQSATPLPFEPAPLVGQAIDPTRPAFVPRFAKADAPPAGHFEERRYAYVYTYPSPFFYGYGYGGFGYAGFGYGFGGPASWGSTQVPFR